MTILYSHFGDPNLVPDIVDFLPTGNSESGQVEVSFTIDDYNADISTLDVSFTYDPDGSPATEQAIIDGVFQAGYGGTITPIGSGYDVVISTHPTFVQGEYQADVYVEDTLGESGSETWRWSVLYIVDQAYNALLEPATASMLGYVESISEQEALALRIYLFLIETIRIEDANNGEYFVKRYLDGPQAVWDILRQNIFNIKDLWSVIDCPDEYLQYLKLIVGWTKDLDPITDALDYSTLRRLIDNSASLWKTRGPSSSMTSIITLVTGARTRLWDWFDYRWVLDETDLGHENDGYDPWLIAADDERELNIRVVDDGNLDKELVVNLLKLMRPMCERIEITYLDLLDLFNVDADDTQWDALDDLGQTGSTVLTVSGGSAQLDDTARREEIFTNVAGSGDWDEFAYSARVRGQVKFGLTFYRADEDNYYLFRLNTSGATDNFELVQRAGGVETVIATTPVPVGFLVDPLTYYMFRVQVAREGASARIVCFVDGNEMINTTDLYFTEGAVGVMHDVGGTAEVDEVEVLGLPTETDYIDINS